MEERCKACRMLGGEEIPCVTEGEMRQIRERSEGRLECPRAELDPSCIEAAMIAPYLVSEDLRPVAQLFAEAILCDSTPDEVVETLELAHRAIGDESFQRVLRPWAFKKPDPPPRTPPRRGRRR